MLTLSQRRSWARHGDREIQRTIDAAKAELAASAAAERAAARTAYAERNKPVPFTSEELRAATHVRTTTGWHKVVRVSAKSVTVETGYSWTDRHPLARILQVAPVMPSLDPVTHAVRPWSSETWTSSDGTLAAKPGTYCAEVGSHLFVASVCANCGLTYR